jgi:heme exporter protein A
LREGQANPKMQLVGRDLVCVRGGRQVFAGCNFAVAAGQALVITGPNGAGKSSLLRMVAGLLRIEAGRVELHDGNSELTIAEQAHFLGHHDALKSSLSVAENLHFWNQYLNGSASQTSTALERVGLAGLADLPASFLSAGQRRRLSIARLIAIKRAVWLLDEPTAALDVTGQARLSELMHAHLDDGGIILAATHGPLGIDASMERGLTL